MNEEYDDPNLRLVQDELTRRTLRRAPAGGSLCLAIGLMVAFWGLYFFGVIARYFGWR